MSVTAILRNRSFAGLLLSNTILASAFPVQLILGGLAGLLLAPAPELATLPSSVQTLAAALAAAPFSLLMGRVGRRLGFALGSLLTIVGALFATQALYSENFTLLCAGHFLMGAGWASFQYFRFAAGEVVDKEWQAVAISLMRTSGLVAAIAGPQLFIVAKDGLSPTPFAGAYASLIILSLVGLIPLALARIPIPERAAGADVAGRFSVITALRRPPIRRAIGIAAVSQGIMVFLMIPTPLAMVESGFSDVTASDVIRWHIVAMFAPSFFTGFLIKRFGVHTIANIGLVIIILSAFAAAMGVSVMHFYGALIVLGIGWNFSFIGATTMLAAAVTDGEKAAIQGANDTIIAMVSTVCAFAAGFVISNLGWPLLAIISGGVVVLMLVILAFDKAMLDAG
ncbi:MAG: MFS transporter [Pseudomonadota bacterium]